ncbi:MAG: hypothetical protein N3D20_02150 [Candidatus Pacearchaeota archaeon]|nr:hypothetical protein [Candidatus Pacearchaeota archaeon]
MIDKTKTMEGEGELINNKSEKTIIKEMRSKKGQVAIFVIVALVIVGAILLVLLYPRIKESIAPPVFNPENFLRDCIKDDVRNSVNILASRGGYENPEGYLMYKGMKIKYLCYINGYYKTCIVQEPMIKNTFESEMERMLKQKINSCAYALKTEYERKGFSVKMGAIYSDVEIVLDKIRVNFIVPMKITKEETTQSFEKFSVDIPSKMYDLLMITTSIIDFEAAYGDSETTLYMQYYPNLKIEKILYSGDLVVFNDGSKIYNVSDVTTGDYFVFASRSLVWPAGYGIQTFA